MGCLSAGFKENVFKCEISSKGFEFAPKDSG